METIRDLVTEKVNLQNSCGKISGGLDQKIEFVKEGEKVVKRKKHDTPHGILSKANDWQVKFDLPGSCFVFPSSILVTHLRPDFVVWSDSGRHLLIGELTVPWEEHIEADHEFKADKYAELVGQCKERHWNVSLFPVEVGCRGFLGKSMGAFLRKLGCKGRDCKAVERSALHASLWIWKRHQMDSPAAHGDD